jgi:hypothetical protein
MLRGLLLGIGIGIAWSIIVASLLIIWYFN